MKSITKLPKGYKMPRVLNALPSSLLKGLLTVCLFLSFNLLIAGSVTGPTIVCVGDQDGYCYSGSATGPLTYFWHVSSGGSFSGSGNCITVTWNIAGNDSVWVNVYNKVLCTWQDSGITFVTVNPLPLPGIFTQSNQACVTLKQPNDPTTSATGGTNGNDTCYLVCDSSTTVFYANFVAGATYTWSVTGASGDTISTSASGSSYTVNWGGTLGVAEIKLVVTTGAGCSDSTTRCVDIIQKPHCKFFGDTVACGGVLKICKGQTVTFRDSSTSSSSSGISSWLWNFGDNTTSTNADPTHQYNIAGTYIVTLIVTNQCGCKDSCELKVIVDSTTGPNIYCPTTICAGDTGFYWTDAICSSYLWSVTGGTIIGDSTRDTIRVAWGNGNSGPGIISLSMPSSCATYCQYSNYVTVPIVPINGIIYGPTIVCADPTGSTSTRYSMNCIPGTYYTWTLSNPALGYISTNSNGPTEISINWFGPTGWDTIEVTYNNSLLGCGGTAKLAVHVTNPFTLYGPTESCAGDTSKYYTSPVGMFKWVVYDDFTNLIINSTHGTTLTQIWPMVTSVTSYTVFAIDTLGIFCNSPQIITVTVYPLPSQPGTISGITCVCPNESYTYSAIPTASNYYLQWTILNGSPTTSVGTSINVTWGPIGPYKIILQQGMIASPHCPSLPEIVTVNVCPPISGSISGTTKECINQTETYTFPAGGSDYTWSVSGLGSVISGNNTNTATIEWGDVTGITTIHLSYSICGVTYNVSIADTVTPAPVPIIVLPTLLCGNSLLNFTTSAISGSSQYIWTIVGGPTITTPTGLFSYTFTPGTYTLDLTVVDISNCLQNGSTAVTFTVNPAPAAFISTPDPLTTCNLPDTFYVTITSTGCIGGTTYQWYGPAGAMGTATTQFSRTVYPKYGNYYCIVTNSCGCTAETNILSLDSCGVIPPPCTLTITPSISFTPSQNCGTVTFTSTHSLPGFIPGSYSWTFGDGIGTSTAQNPVYTYAHPGYYLVDFCCSYTDGTDTCSICYQTTDTVPLIPNFTVSYSCSGSGPILTTITNNSQTVSPYTYVSYSWTGAITGTASSVSAPLIAGLYNETLTVTVTGYSKIYTCTITLPFTVPIQPIASFTIAPNPACSGVPINFTNTSTNPGAIIQYNWTFGDGGGSNLSDPIHSYTAPIPPPFINHYPVTLIILDEYGCTSSATGTATIFPNTIFKSLTPMNGEACEGDTIILSANGSSSHFMPLSFSWIPCGHYTAFDTVTQTGYYTVIITDAVGCTAIDSAQATFLDIPTPAISGPLNYCNGDKINLSMYVGPGYTYVWTVSSPTFGTTTVSSSDLNGITLYNFYSPYTIKAYISVNTPISCIDSATDTVYVHLPPPIPIISAPDTCLKDAPIILTATDANPYVLFNWSTGGFGNTISVINSGIIVVTATDSNGCSSQSNPFIIPALPDFCTLFTGCLCDTGNQIITAPTGYTVIGWLRNDTLLAPTVAWPNLLITLPGTYQLILQDPAAGNCPDTSGFINVDDCKPTLCCCCDSSVVYFKTLACIGPDSLGHEQYQFDIYYDYTGSSASPYNVIVGSPNNGSLSGMITGILYPGINDITGIFTDTPPVGTSLCLEIIHTDSVTGASCKQEVCSILPPCDGLPPCNQIINICESCGGIRCSGNDLNGDPIYLINFSINYTGSNNSSFYISSTQGTFSSLSSSVVNNGGNNYSVMFINTPPWQGFMCMTVVIRDSATAMVCEEQFCFTLPVCPISPCRTDRIQIGPRTACIGMDSTGHEEYFIQLYVFDPYSCCSQSLSVLSSTGFISNQNPLSFNASLTDVTFDYTNYSSDSTTACFRIIITDSISGAQCEDTICINLPHCQNATDRRANSLSLKPNPAQNQTVITYSFIQSGDNEIVIRDNNGIEFGRFKPSGLQGSLTYDVSSLNNGVYQVSAESGGGRLQTVKLIVTK